MERSGLKWAVSLLFLQGNLVKESDAVCRTFQDVFYLALHFNIEKQMFKKANFKGCVLSFIIYENWDPIHGEPYVTYKTVYYPTYECYSTGAPFQGSVCREGKKNLNLPIVDHKQYLSSPMVRCNIFPLKEITYNTGQLNCFLDSCEPKSNSIVKKKKKTLQIWTWYESLIGADCAPKSWTVFFIIILHVFVLNFLICDELLLRAV